MPKDGDVISVCLCLSGQMRSFEENFGWLKHSDKGVTVSVVVATWSERGGKLFGALGGLNRMRGFFPSDTLGALPASWASPHLFEHLPGLRERAIERAKNERITAESIRRILPNATVHVEDTLRFSWFEQRQFKGDDGIAPDPFSMSMLYKIWQADVLRKNLESAQGKKFDVVIRARPDFAFEPPTGEFLRHVAAGDIYLDRFSHTEQAVGDGFALGTSEVMDIYGQFFMTAYPMATADRWHYVHSDFYDYLVTSGVQLKRYPMLGYSPDRMVDLADLLAALARNPELAPQRDPGYVLAGEADVALIGDGIVLIDRLSRNEARTVDPSVLDHIAKRLADFVPERDGGFFHTLSTRLMAEEEAALAVLCMGVSVFEMPDGLPVTVGDVYLGDFAHQLRSLISAADDFLDAARLFAHCSGAAAHSPHPVQAHICEFLCRPSNRSRAVAALEMLIGSLARNPAHWNWFIDYYEQRGDFSQAEQVTRIGLREAPDDPVLSARLALVLTRQGASTAAADVAGVAASSADAWSVFLSAKALLQAGFPDRAETALRRAIELAPADADFYMELSALLLKSDRRGEAVAMARDAAARSPEPMAHRHNHLGHVLYACGLLGEAEAAFREALRRNPAWDDARSFTSQMLADQGRFLDAIKLELDRTTIDPNDDETKRKIANWLKKIDKRAQEFDDVLQRIMILWP
jgi:tetratricopeptide (TPR) repeat protein